MVQKEVEVKAAGKVVGKITVEVFDSIEESVETLGDETVLKMINRQRRNELCNRVRVQAAQDSPEKQIAALARAAKRGEISKADAAARIRELAATLS